MQSVKAATRSSLLTVAVCGALLAAPAPGCDRSAPPARESGGSGETEAVDLQRSPQAAATTVQIAEFDIRPNAAISDVSYLPPPEALRANTLTLFREQPELSGDDSAPRYALRVEYATFRESPSSAQLLVAASGELRPERGRGGDDLTLSHRVIMPVESGDAPSRDPERLEPALRALGEVFAKMLQARAAEDDALARWLEDANPAVAAVAVREVRRRGLSSYGPALVELLDTDDDELFGVVVGALAELRYKPAVQPLIDSAELMDARRLSELIVPALAQIGGRDVVYYLLVLEDGHPSPVVRRAAESLLPHARRDLGTPQPDPRGGE